MDGISWSRFWEFSQFSNKRDVRNKRDSKKFNYIITFKKPVQPPKNIEKYVENSVTPKQIKKGFHFILSLRKRVFFKNINFENEFGQMVKLTKINKRDVLNKGVTCRK